MTLEETVDLVFTLNGTETRATVAPSQVLSDLLREQLALKGLNVACGRTVCGACTVLIDGVPRAACSTFAFEVDGAAVLTIEGLEAEDGALDPVQIAFAKLSAFQCGYCTPGMILIARALLDAHPMPDEATIREHISSNICRCTGYGLILEAVADAARMRAGEARA